MILRKGTRVAISPNGAKYSGFRGIVGTIVNTTTNDKGKEIYVVRSDNGHYSWWTAEELVVQR